MSQGDFGNFIVSYRDRMRFILRIVSFLFALIAFGAFVLYYGIEWPEKIEEQIFLVVRSVIGFFLLNYFVRLILFLDYREFIKENWFESFLVALLLVDMFYYYGLGIPVLENTFQALGIKTFTPFYILFIQLYLLVLAGMEIIRTVQQLYKLRVSPVLLFIGTFTFLILTGTGLLMLPEMTVQQGTMNFWDALFTATSATCVTGLIVVDTATFFTFKGHFVILVLMQLGGIGIISFALFFSIFMRSGFGIKHDLLIKDYFNAPDISHARKLLIWVIALMLIIEFFGIVCMYYLWGNHLEFDRFGERLFYSVFHSVSAFTNSGFTLFTDGFYNESIRHAYLLHFITGIMIFLGALGFPAIRELTSVELLRERMRKPWLDWSLNTKVSLFTALALVAIGSVVYWYFEQDASLADKNGAEVLITSVFQIVTRTAGFNTVDIGSLALPVLLMLIVFMFIGAASASVGGGIKTSTFIVMLVGFTNAFKRKGEIVLGNRSIPHEVLQKAYLLFVFSVSFIVFVLFLLTITEPDKDFFELMFETVSAFGTVGLSTGITGDLTTAGQILITATMFVGRLGMLAIVVIMSSTVSKPLVRHPQENLMIG